jgi:ABC-type sugar transport system permease subunit
MSTATMAIPQDQDAPPDLGRQLRTAERRRRLRSMALTLPLLAFLLVVFVVPLAGLLVRAIENPEVADTLGHTGAALQRWDRQSAPPDAAYAALVRDLSALQETAQAGALARRLNSEISGARSLIMGTYRALPLGTGLSDAEVRERMLALDPRWAELPYWLAIAKNASRWTPDYLLAAVDLQRTSEGRITQVPAEAAAFRDILVRTFEMSATVTLLAILIGYPLSYWLSTLSERRANLMMILVLVPFWTSVLVRIAAWIVLLQSNGLVNRFLISIGLTDTARAAAVQPAWRGDCHGAYPAALPGAAAVQRDEVHPAQLPARRHLAGQHAAGRVLPRLCTANLPRRGRGRPAGVHHRHRLLRHPGAAGRPERPDAELLRGAVHQRRGQLGHGGRARLGAAGDHPGALCRVPQVRQG